MGSGVFNVAVSGLNAAQLGIQTTSHNISNVSTTGYNRQRIEQTTNTPIFTGAGFIGQGTSVETVNRVYSKYLTEQVLAAQSNVDEADAYLEQIQQIDNLLADPNAGLSPAMAEFFKAVQDLAANPSSIPARQATLSAAQALSARFQSLDTRIQEVRDGVNQQVLGEVEVINGLITAIADANQQVILSRAAGPNQSPNDLLDKRDQLIADLNSHIRVDAVAQNDGTFNIFIGNGTPVVVGTQVSTLTGKQALDDPEKISLAIESPFGGSFYLLESQITGGALGGLIKFRAESLDAAQNNLGRVALGLAQTFNAIHQSGQDLSGVLGAQFFATSAPVVNSSLLNASSGTLVSAQIITSDYRVVFNGGNYDITRLSDGTSFPGQNLPWVADGVEISATVAPNLGDSFIVKPGNSPGQRVIAESTNTGAGVLDSTGSNLAALDGSDFRLDYLGANTWRLSRLSDNTVWTAAGATDQEALDNLLQNQPGFSMTLAGVPPTLGDSFLIQPTRTVARNIEVAINDPRGVAAAAPFRTSGALTNTGQAAISSGSVAYVGNGNLPMAASPGGDITLTFSSSVPALGGIPGFTVSTGGAVTYNPATQTKIDITLNGLSFSISGAPAAGDRFTLARNDNGVSDNRNAQLLGAIQTSNILNGASSSNTTGANATLQSAYSQIVSRIGSKAREIEVTGQAQESLATQAKQSQAQLSGVNLDEEAANLLKYQQAYQAAAKMLAVVGTLFDELLALGN